MSDEYDEDVERFEKTQQKLSEALAELDRRVAAGGDEAERLRLLTETLHQLDALREFIIRDLGTVVGNLQRVETGLGSVGEYVTHQRDAVNDLSATLAALVDVLIENEVIGSEDLLEKKNELLNSADTIPVDPDEKSN